MDAGRWRRLNDLFHAAVARPAGERTAWLRQACPDDPALAAEVERLADAHERAASFIRTADSPHAVLALGAPPLAGLPAFAGTDRFVVRRTLGVGGMGVVYEVEDRARGGVVALKTLLRARPTDIYRLKREFRSLADVAHRNLASLYELFVDGDRCFFTMELVDGVNFGAAVRGGAAEWPRVRRLFRQLVEGVLELHRRGKLHRDLKPSNVLVTRDDRVVVLDFGLVAEQSAPVPGVDDQIAGTPAYMPPEQARGGLLSEASDWYAVGATLYEALTGQVPVANTPDPPSPQEISSDVPDDLAGICTGLLCRDRDRRLSGAAALDRLRDDDRRARVAARRESPGPARFVGREPELDALGRALAATRAGHPAAVYVYGPSGIGKSTLVTRFLDRVGEPAVVLAGRCYEHESVPYKALDGVVDSLSHYLSSLPAPARDAIVPRDIAALARLFPVLGRIPGARPGADPERDADPLVARRRAFAALRDLLAAIGRERRLILFIDDLHWADADSAVLVRELLNPPGAPPLLLLACARTEEFAAKPFLQQLRDEGALGIPIALAPLSDTEARELVATLAAPASRPDGDDALRIVREGEGNPFFLEQLARYAAPGGEAARTGGPTMATVLEGRLQDLPEGAREFLDVLAICGRPMSPPLVHAASGLDGDERPLVSLLRAGGLVRSSSGERIELYHDRIREALTARMEAGALRRRHGQVARTLAGRQIDDPEALFEHYRGAGEHEPASDQAARAAEKAARALAFDRAAAFYRHALELAPASAERGAWKEQLAAALANAGRPADAAGVYLEAAEGARGSRRLELQRRGADQLLIGGRIDRGVEVMRGVLAAAGMRLPSGPWPAFASLLLGRARLRWRGLGFVERPAQDLPADTLLRIDTCWSVMTGMAMVDNVRALDFQTRHLRLALDAGEPYRIARAFAAETGFLGTRGAAAYARAEAFTRRATELSARVGDPHAIAFTTLTAGVAALLNGRWRPAAELLGRAITLLRETCIGVTWELNLAQNFFLGALLYQGKLRDVADQLRTVIPVASDSGNLFLETELRTRMMSLLLVAEDRPADADAQADEVMRRWWQGGFTRQHYNHLLGRGYTALYRGDGQAAWRIVADHDRLLRRSLLSRIQTVRLEWSYLRGRGALAAAVEAAPGSAARRRLLAIARRQARRLAGERMPWSDGFGHVLAAGVSYQDGLRTAAEQQLAAGVAAFDGAGMQLYAAAARRCLGLVAEGRGTGLVDDAEGWMAGQEIRNFRAMTRMIAPGFADR